MKSLKLILVILYSVASFTSAAQASKVLDKWNQLSIDEQAEFLDLEMATPMTGTKVISIEGSADFKLTEVYYPPYRNFVKKLLATAQAEISTEEFEQSDYPKVGEPYLSELYLLVTQHKEILGAQAYFRQEGTLEDGTDGDVNWSAYVRFNSKAEVLRDENGLEYDDLYYEWSGH